MTDKNTIILVAGMHRSGTSAIARVLNLLGVDLPGELIKPSSDNPRGFWENARIVAFHDKLCEEAGKTFTDMLAFPENWFASEGADRAVDELVELLRDELDDRELSLVKDPRICRFLPLWYRALDRLGLGALTLLPLRHPFNVAASLTARNKLTQSEGLMLWTEHVMAAERDSRTHARAFCSYDDLMDDWYSVTGKIAADFGIEWPVSREEIKDDVEQHLERKLQHHGRIFDDPRARNGLHELALRAWRSFGRLGGDDTDEAARKDLDSIFVEFQAHAGPSAEISNALRRQLRVSDAKLAEQDRVRREWYEPQLERRQHEIERLTAELEKADKTPKEWYEPELERLHVALDEAEKKRTEELEPQLERLGDEVARLTDEGARHEKEYETIVITAARDDRAALRRRVMHHAEQAQRQARVIRRAETQAATANAELARLRSAIHEYEKIKSEWFEPQLNSRFARIEWLESQLAVLQARLDSLSGFEKSRAFRAWRKLRRNLRLD